jgi:hypothetical protein
MKVGLQATIPVGKDEEVKPYIQNVTKIKEKYKKIVIEI